MEPYKSLYKSVGLPEWRLLRAEGADAFPPRMLRHRLYYPLLTYDRACQFAREWHTGDQASEYCGLVLAIPVRPDFLLEYEARMEAEDGDTEALWLTPAENLAINPAMLGRMRVCEAFYGVLYDGPQYTPLEWSDEAILL